MIQNYTLKIRIKISIFVEMTVTENSRPYSRGSHNYPTSLVASVNTEETELETIKTAETSTKMIYLVKVHQLTCSEKQGDHQTVFIIPA